MVKTSGQRNPKRNQITDEGLNKINNGTFLMSHFTNEVHTTYVTANTKKE